MVGSDYISFLLQVSFFLQIIIALFFYMLSFPCAYSTCSPKYPSFSLNWLLPRFDPQMFLNLPSASSWEWALLLSFVGFVVLCRSCVFFLGLALFSSTHLLKKRMRGDKFWDLPYVKTFRFQSHLKKPQKTLVFRTF